MNTFDITKIDQRKINIAFIIITGILIFSTLLLTLFSQFENTTDAYYMGYYGEQILTTGHIPTTIELSYGELPIKIQNLLPSIAYALAFRLGNITNIGDIAIKIAHILSIISMCLVCILIGRKNKQQTILILCAITVALSQYSIIQIRPHILFTTCLMIIAETYYLIINKKEYNKGWIAAAIIATIIATNSQHLIAITIPMTLCGMFVFTPKITLKEKAKTLPFVLIVLLLTLFATPPESGNILEGILYTQNSPDTIYIKEMASLTTNPAQMLLLIAIIISQITLSVTTEKKSHLPFVIMSTIVCISTFWQIRNQYLACTLISLSLLTLQTKKDINLTKIALVSMSIAMCLTVATKCYNIINIYNTSNENYIEKQGNLEILNYPQNVPDIKDKKILCIITYGSWFKQKGALPLMISQTEIHKNIDGTGAEFANQIYTILQERTEDNKTLKKTPKITDIVYDYCIVHDKTVLNELLKTSPDWKKSNIIIPDQNVYENITHKTLEEQGLCK